MIINCENCNKKFNLDKNLLGEKGRLLQCSNCNHKWFFKHLQKSEKKLKINNDNIELSNSTKNNNLNDIEAINKKINKPQKKNRSNNWINNFIIIFIILISLIIIVDTFKVHLSNILPGLTPLLENLYKSLHDLQLFLKDLFS